MSSTSRLPGIVGGLALGLLVPVATAAHAHFTRPIAHPGTHAIRESIVLVVFLAPVVSILGYLLATRRSLDRVRPIVAWTAAIACATVFAFSARRPDDVESEAARMTRLVHLMGVAGELTVDGPPVTVGALSIDLRDPGECHVRIATHGGIETYPWPGVHVGTCAPVRVKHDPANEIAVIQYIPLWAMRSSRAWQTLAIHSTRDGHAVSLDDGRVSRGSAIVPTSWALLASFSSACALILLLAAKVHRRRAAALATSTDAVHEGKGWFALDDGRRFFVRGAVDLVLGTFMVRVEEPRVANYRASASATVEPVSRGTRRDRVDAPREMATNCDAIALAVAAAGMMPALMALVVLDS